MNCKKCGAELNTQTPFCPYCGTEIPKEEPIVPEAPKKQECKKCGAELTMQTPFCPYCGTEIPKEEEKIAPTPPAEPERPVLTEEKESPALAEEKEPPVLTEEKESPTPEQKPEQPSESERSTNYKAYIPQTKTKLYYRIAASSLSLLLVLLFLFLPIYQFRLPESSNGYQVFTQLPEKKQQQVISAILSSEAKEYGFDERAINNLFYSFSESERADVIRKAIINGEAPTLSYSAYDEIRECLRFFGKGNMSAMDAIALIVYIFPLFEWLFGIILIVGCAKKIYDDIVSLKKLDETTLLAYEEIKRSGGKAEKLKFLQKQSIVTILLYAVFDVVFGKIDNMLLQQSGMSTSAVAYSAMVTGVSASIILIVMGLVGYFVFNHLVKKRDTEISVAILREE